MPWVADGYKESLAKRLNSGGSIVESIDNMFHQTGAGSWIEAFDDSEKKFVRNGKRRVKSANEATRITTNYSVSLGYNRYRPKSASAKQELRRSQAKFQPPSRPRSAQVPARRPMSGLPSRRIKSAGMERRSAGDLQKSYTMIVRTYEHGKFQSSINANPDCRYFDRHARCFDHTHLHSKLIWTRPQKPCRVGGWCGPPTERDLDEYAQSQIVGSSGRKAPDESWEVELDERQLRYVACLRPWTSATRPRTAPTTVRLEHKGFTKVLSACFIIHPVLGNRRLKSF